MQLLKDLQVYLTGMSFGSIAIRLLLAALAGTFPCTWSKPRPNP
ncbi:MAG: hypothetical protein VZR00_09780 [Lachnospiraceae bacterium]|jgi:hypothetical protein|nr:hypothetical protein [Lachnospiraceae bacterium]MEE3462152.1 hypothetical protein [Lachnospiraceae bacterium]